MGGTTLTELRGQSLSITKAILLSIVWPKENVNTGGTWASATLDTLGNPGCVIAPARNAFLTFACLERALFLIFMLSLLHEWRGWASDQQARGRSCCAVDLSSKPLLFQISIDCCFFFYSSWVITLTPLSSTILHSGNSTSKYLSEGNENPNLKRSPTFTAALFTIAKIWKQPKCPSIEEWIKKTWYIY